MYADVKQLTLIKTNKVRIYLVPQPKLPVLSLLKKSVEGRKIYDALSSFSPKFFIIAEKIEPADCVLGIDPYCSVITGSLVRIMGKKFVLRANDSILSLSSQMLSSYSRAKGLLFLLYSFLVESYVSLLSNAISVPSNRTKQLFKKYYGLDKKVFVSPQGNQNDTSTESLPIRQKYNLSNTQPIVLFIGTGNWPPNILAIEYIQEVLAPYLEKEIPEARIFIVGSKTSGFECRTRTNNLFVVGEVPSLRPYLESADIAIAPVSIIGGVSSKIISYLCSGLPVVATHEVAETLFPQKGLFVCKMDNFCFKVKEVIKNEQLHFMKPQIRKEALNHYSWEKIGYEFATFVCELYDKAVFVNS
jgi:glycosyltransferase involved in cell wall biosynthesis